MFHLVIKYEIKKNLIIFLVLIVIYTAYKYYQGTFYQSNPELMNGLNKMIAESSNLGIEEKQKFLEEYRIWLEANKEKLPIEELLLKNEIATEYNTLLGNASLIKQLIDNAKYDTGIKGYENITREYLDHLDDYKKLEYSTLLNDFYWNKFYHLQSYNMAFIWVAFFVLLVFSPSYETQMDHVIRNLKNGTSYMKMKWFVSLICVLLLILFNFIFDFILSGLATSNIGFSYTIQSISIFNDIYLPIHISDAFISMLLINITNAFICLSLFHLFSRKLKDLKNCLIAIIFFSILSLMVREVFVNVSHFISIGSMVPQNIFHGRFTSFILVIGFNITLAITIVLYETSTFYRKYIY